MKSMITLLGILLVLASVRTCHAERSLSLAERNDDFIHRLSAKLLNFVEDYDTPPPEGAVILDQGLYLDISSKQYLIGENYVLYVFNPDAAHITEQTLTVPRDRQLKSYGAWILRRNGDLERLDTSGIELLDTGKGQGTKVLFPFPSVHEGDILSWSVVSGAKDRLFNFSYLLSNVFPTKYAVAFIITDGEVAYRAEVDNVIEDNFFSDVKEKKHGAPSRLKFTFIDIPPVSRKTHSLPFRLREPLLTVSYRGSYYARTGQWIYIQSWPQLALTIDDFMSTALQKDKTVASKARELTAAAAYGQDAIDALYRFTRDEIDDLPSFEFGDDSGRPAAILETGAGNFVEKAMLLAALISSDGTPIDIGFVHSRNMGPFDSKFPSFEQFDAAVVEAPRGSGRWYDPSCALCPAGQLSPALHGAKVFIPRWGLEKANDAIWSDVVAEVGGSERLLIRNYLKAVAKAPWCRFGELPASPDLTHDTTHESVAYDPQTHQAHMHLESEGWSPLCRLARSTTRVEDLADSCLSSRYGVEKILRCRLDSSAEEIEGNHLGLDVTFTPELTETRAGEVYILPSELVFGKPSFPDWDGPRRRVFHTPTTEIHHYEWSMPLPDGYTESVATRSLLRDFGPLHYLGRIEATGDSLRVTRALTMNEGTIYEDNIEGLDEAIQAIQAFEAQSITLERGGEASGG